jgi:3-carboxy-cis,cis-muconate cycloisomerase
MVARTVTQPAVPTTFGAKATGWLNGVVDAYQQVATLATPVQIGGAGGTLAAATEVASLLEHGEPSGSIGTLGADHRKHTWPVPCSALAYHPSASDRGR